MFYLHFVFFCTFIDAGLSVLDLVLHITDTVLFSNPWLKDGEDYLFCNKPNDAEKYSVHTESCQTQCIR